MKTIKRIISAILCATLLFTIAIPAFAADEPSDPSLMPVITKQPKNLWLIDYDAGETFHSTDLEASIPGGGEVGYELYHEGELYKTQLEPSLNYKFPAGKYYYVVYNIDHPEYRVQSEDFRLRFRKPPLYAYVGAFLFESFIAFAVFVYMPIKLIVLNPGIIFDIIRSILPGKSTAAGLLQPK